MMVSRKKIEVQQIKLTPPQIQAAIKSASESIQACAAWKAPQAATQQTQEKK
jgi:hypothetical protein